MNGITILASDVLDQNLRRDHEEEFNLTLAIAVFEHITDFRSAVEAAMALLRTDGLLLFEVPLLSDKDPSDPWLRTSLEHIHYPTERSLHYLFESILGLELVGSSVLIRRFGQTYVGLAAKSRKAMEAAAQCFDRCIRTPPDRLTIKEARLRCLFGLLHAADTSPEMLALCEYLTPSDLNPLTVRRLLDLWKADTLWAKQVSEHCEHVESYLKEVEAARDWHAEESKKRDKIIQEVRMIGTGRRGLSNNCAQIRPKWKRRGYGVFPIRSVPWARSGLMQLWTIGSKPLIGLYDYCRRFCVLASAEDWRFFRYRGSDGRLRKSARPVNHQS